MREIKFRVWDNILNEYFSWEDSVKFNNYHDLIEDNYDGAVVLEEFTGLKDKNGVDVYEGDVVETTYYNDVDDDLGKIGTIVFERGGFYIIFVGDNSKNNLGFIEPDETMVIGNAHQNADLFEEQS